MNWGSVLDVVGSTVSGALLSQLAGLIRIDHPMTHEFAVEIDGIPIAGFASVEGLSDRATPYEFDSASQQGRNKVFPYKRTLGMVTLKNGLSFRGRMEEWYYDMINFQKGGKSPLRDASFLQLYRVPKNVPLLGGQLIEVKRWTYPKAVCRDLTFPKYDAKRDEVSILEAIVESTKPDWVQPPTSFGQVGSLLDVLTK